MTIGEYTKVYRGKRVVDFKMGDSPTAGDIAYRLAQEYDSSESQSELLEDFFSKVGPESIETLIVGPWSEASSDSPQGFIDGLIERRAQLGGLKALFVDERLQLQIGGAAHAQRFEAGEGGQQFVVRGLDDP